jgi:predicted dithiol-disulfide oxidoreductase (DUF899 family)
VIASSTSHSAQLFCVSTYSKRDGRSEYDRGEMFGLSVYPRDGEDVYRTYFTTARGVDRLRVDFNLLDPRRSAARIRGRLARGLARRTRR